MKINKFIPYALVLLIAVAQCSITAIAAEKESIDPIKILLLYKRHCAICHGDDGKGQTKGGIKAGVKDYTDLKVAEKLKDTKKMAMTVLQGLEDKEGKLKMAPFNRKLKPLEAVGLIKYLEHFSKKKKE